MEGALLAEHSGVFESDGKSAYAWLDGCMG
jgi:hypothetical protein